MAAAPDLGSGVRKDVGVRLSPSAPMDVYPSRQKGADLNPAGASPCGFESRRVYQCESGGAGRRAGFKSRCLQRREGSTPSTRTTIVLDTRIVRVIVRVPSGRKAGRSCNRRSFSIRATSHTAW